MRTVIHVASDPASTEAARWVVGHLAPEAEHLLVHVLEARHPKGDESRPAGLERAREEASRRLEELRDELGSGVSTELREGRIHEVLAEACRERRADLLVVAIPAESEEEPENDQRGKATQKILRHASLPLLVVRPAPDAPRHLRRILAAVDDSEETATVLAWSRRLQELSGAELTVAHVFHSSYAGVARLVSGAKTRRNLESQQRKQTSSWLEEEVREAGIAHDEVTLEVAEGDPAKAILALDARLEPDLLVIGSRGPGAVEETLMGSVASTVARSASASVLITRRNGTRTGGSDS